MVLTILETKSLGVFHFFEKSCFGTFKWCMTSFWEKNLPVLVVVAVAYMVMLGGGVDFAFGTCLWVDKSYF